MSEQTQVFYSFFSAQHGTKTIYELLEFDISQNEIKEHIADLISELESDGDFYITHITAFVNRTTEPNKAFGLSWERSLEEYQ